MEQSKFFHHPLSQTQCYPIQHQPAYFQSTFYGTAKSPLMEKNLSKSDYELFIKKSEEANETDYPSCFDFIRISPSSQIHFFKDIENIDAPILEFTKSQLIDSTLKIIMQNNFARMKFTESNLKKLITKIALSYKEISYHNFSHAFSLMQMFWRCLKLDTSFENLYSEEEVFYTFIAGLAHDINHNGTNNAFEKKLQSKYAKLSNNASILEWMHIRYFFSLLKQNSNFDVLKKSEKPVKMKELMIRAIIATDISTHFMNIKKFSQKRNEKSLKFKFDENRYFALEQVFHACDIGNPCLEYKQYINWSSLLSYEFNEQTKLEKKNGLQVTEFLVYKGKKQFYKGQINFINGIVLPQWRELSYVWKGFQHMIQRIEQNLKEVEKRKDEEQ